MLDKLIPVVGECPQPNLEEMACKGQRSLIPVLFKTVVSFRINITARAAAPSDEMPCQIIFGVPALPDRVLCCMLCCVLC